MASLFLVPLMASLWLALAPNADRPVLSIAPDAKVTLRHVKVGDRSFIIVTAAGVTFETVRLRVRLDGNGFDFDAVDAGIRLEVGEEVGIFKERTLVLCHS